MRVPLSWLCDFAPFEAEPAELAAALDDLGLVVEDVERVGAGLGDVVVARVEAIDAIAGADKIRKVTVDAGGEPLEVVCGAWNFAVGDLVPLAPVGAVLPGDFAISRRKLRGVTSNGMLCSPAELALGDDHGGILVLGHGSQGPQPGAPLLEALGISADTVFDIAVEANRPDAWSVAGVARDLAARLRLPFTLPDPEPVPPAAAGTAVTVDVVDTDLCPRFTAGVLTGVSVGASPDWLARRLVLAGMRPINNVVDASNYVMLELGQPTHPYDLSRVAGGGLRIRAAAPGEAVVTLDGVRRPLGGRSVGPGDDRRDCVICDAEDSPIGIAGIMGGASSDITDTTTTVLLEAAYFAPMAVARTSKRLNLRTEASARFERGCDPEGVQRAAARLCQLVSRSAGAGFGADPTVVDRRGPVPVPPRLTVRTARVNAVLGTDLDDDDVAGYLTPIGFVCEPVAPGLLQVTVPSFRPDTTREIDVVEEVARHHSYSQVRRQALPTSQVGRLSPYQRLRRQVCDIAAGLYAHQAWTPSLLRPGDHGAAGLGDDAVAVANPLTPDESVLRRSLLPGLLRALAFNADRRQGELRLFEVGHVFPVPDPERVRRALARRGDTVIDEREQLAVLFGFAGDDARVAVTGWRQLADALGVDDVALRSPADDGGLHPTRSAALVGPGDTAVGAVGEVDPDVAGGFGLGPRRLGWLQVDLEVLAHLVAQRRRLVQPISAFPSSDVDLAFVVPDAVPAAAVAATIETAAGAVLEDLALFDVYRGAGIGPGERGLTFGLRLCAFDHTLSGAEVAEVREAVMVAVEKAHGARRRG